MTRTSSPVESRFGIRHYEDRDLEPVFQIFDQPQCRRFLGREPFATEAEVKAWFDVMPKKTIKLVATAADVSVGVGVLVPDAGSRAHVGVLGLFVHDRFHRLGIGSLLLQVLMASGQRFYLQRLELSVVCNNEAALRFYLKSGFQIEGRLAGVLRYGGRFHVLTQCLCPGMNSSPRGSSMRAANQIEPGSAACPTCRAAEPPHSERDAGDPRIGWAGNRRNQGAP
jgi:L-phenylalanine/L-methionine N-acetyltransferase